MSSFSDPPAGDAKPSDAGPFNADVPESPVATEAVPVERVRLGTETVTEQQTVTGDVRKEQIEVDDPTANR